MTAIVKHFGIYRITNSNLLFANKGMENQSDQVFPITREF